LPILPFERNDTFEAPVKHFRPTDLGMRLSGGFVLTAFIAFLGLKAFFPSSLEQSATAESGLVKLPPPIPERLADRVAVSLTGLIATPEEKKDFAEGKISIKELAEKYRARPEFQERLAQFWLQTLQVNSPIPYETIESDGSGGMTVGATVLQNLNAGTNGSFATTRSILFRRPPGCTKARYELSMNQQTFQPAVDATTSQCAALPAGTEKNVCLNRLDLVVRLKTETDRFRLSRNLNDLGNDCKCGTEVDVKPWWNPGTTVAVCPTVLNHRRFDKGQLVQDSSTEERCGNDLRLCTVINSKFAQRGSVVEGTEEDPTQNYYDELTHGFTMEPGVLIAKTIQDDRDFRTVLTTNETTLNGIMEAFYAISEKGGIVYQQMPGKFNNRTSLKPSEGGRKTFRWVNRGNGNAGVFTTPAFQMITNGYRAKANRAYESFLCSQFVIPPGTRDTDPSEPDLTKRQPCASCHVELEPMGKLFGKWPLEGTNFVYKSAIPAAGGFPVQPGAAFHEGEDVSDLGTAFGKDFRFANCAVQRSFEFLLGRGPTELEKSNFVPALTKELNTNNFRIWPVMVQIIESESFSGGQK
jgi:hypothetical protein